MDNPFSKISARISAFKIHGGDFPEGTKLVTQQGEAYLLMPRSHQDDDEPGLDQQVNLTKAP